MAAQIDSFHPHGWRKVAHWAREWGLAAAAIATPLTLMGMLIAVGIFAANGMTKNAEFRIHTEDRLGNIEGDLIGIKATLGILGAQITVAKYSQLSPQELRDHREELREVSKNLGNAKSDTIGFWPVSFQIINLLSQASSSPPVLESFIIKDVIGPLGQASFANGSYLLKGTVSGIIFKNSIIRFDPSVRLSNDQFIHCIFILPPEQNPPKVLQEIGRTLLASDITNVTITAS